ncbi:hypothetical protein ABID56_000318 [Alkalibacillus flavidus]|uniref:Diacylglyceryl transferase n=1 Tax=Alkalibacillus flavidus TaxID=546021 RepID=A0ABV2KS92_9BACI
MNDIIQVGPLNIYIPYLFYIGAILLSTFIGALVYRRMHDGSISKKPADIVIEYWFVFLIVWKLSYFLKHPSDLVNNPLTIIYFDGGLIGIILGFIALGLYWVRQNKRFDTPYLWQAMWSVVAIVILLIAQQGVTFIYGVTLSAIIEILSYIVILYQYAFRPNTLKLTLIISIVRWTAIVWSAFRLWAGSDSLMLIEILIALTIAVATYISEWVMERRTKGGYQ